MVELVLSVIKSVVSLKFAPQIPKTKAKNIKVKDIGKPIKMTNIIAASIIRPIVGFDKPGREDIKSVNHSPPGVISG